MRTFFIYGYVLGLTLASPITRFQECKEGLRRIDDNENNGDHQEKTAHIQMQPEPKKDSTLQPSLNGSVPGMQAKKDESGVKKQTSNIEVRRSPIIKYQRRRDLSHLTQKLPKRRTSGKKHRTNKIIEGHNVYNTSRKTQVNDMFKHNLEKGSILKQLQKRSINYEDTPNDPYHSPDISYDWDTQEDFNENDGLQELNESVGLAKNTDDFTSNIMNENSDPTDSNESDHISSRESSNPRGSSESSSPVGPNESNSSNESNYNIESEEPISDVTDEPIVLNEASDSRDSSEPNVQSSAFTTPVSETTNGFSSESWSQDNSSQSNEHNKSSKSSDSSSNESSSSSDSNTSSHSSAHSDNSTENSSQHIEGTEITKDIEENEIHS